MCDKEKKPKKEQKKKVTKQHVLTREDSEMFKQDHYEKQFYSDEEE